MRIGIIRENKTPPDARTPLTPDQCKRVCTELPATDVVVQPSSVRAFTDEEYKGAGVPLKEDLSDRDLLIGIKEVPVETLIPEKKYLFFSHTVKAQPHNRQLLQRILEDRIELIDFELIRDQNERRVIGFGRYAGIAGAYNAFMAYGRKTGRYSMERAHKCGDETAFEKEIQRIDLAPGTKVVLTGKGTVGKGAIEILEKVGLCYLPPTEYLHYNGEEPVYTALDLPDYYGHRDGTPMDKAHFHAHPEAYESLFPPFTRNSDLFIAAHYWEPPAPPFFTEKDLQDPSFRIRVIADISCDLNGPIPTTLRTTSIADPLYGYDIATGKESDPDEPGSIAVMAVDNLPGELPRNASADFGETLQREVLPYFLADTDQRIERATMTRNGVLTKPYRFLRPFVNPGP